MPGPGEYEVEVGRVARIRSKIGPSQIRQGFEAKKLLPPIKVGLKGWHRAHSQGAGIGAERAAGIFYAPAEVNLRHQNQGIERFIRDVYGQKAANVDIYLKTVTVAHPGTEALKSIQYTVEAERAGERPRAIFTATIEVDISKGWKKGQYKVLLPEPIIHDDLERFLKPVPAKPKTPAGKAPAGKAKAKKTSPKRYMDPRDVLDKGTKSKGTGRTGTGGTSTGTSSGSRGTSTLSRTAPPGGATTTQSGSTFDTSSLARGKTVVKIDSNNAARVTRIRIRKQMLRSSTKALQGSLKYGLPILGALATLDSAFGKIKGIKSRMSGAISEVEKAINEAYPSPQLLWDSEFETDDLNSDFQYSAARNWLYRKGPEAVNADSAEREELLARMGYHLAVVDAYIGHLANLEVQFSVFRDEVARILPVVELRTEVLRGITDDLEQKAIALRFLPFVFQEVFFIWLTFDEATGQMSAVESILSSKLRGYTKRLERIAKQLREANMVFQDWTPLYEDAGGEIGSN